MFESHNPLTLEIGYYFIYIRSQQIKFAEGDESNLAQLLGQIEPRYGVSLNINIQQYIIGDQPCYATTKTFSDFGR